MIIRNPAIFSKDQYDVAIVGGGILGACHALESIARGFRTLLLEATDFGGLTSWSSHRIIHGGLRYLQSFDLKRHRESYRERSWFLRNFPDLVRPLDCLMPLYNVGVKRKGVFRIAFQINDLLSRDRNRCLSESQSIPNGRVLSNAATRRLVSGIDFDRMRGCANWTDGFALCPPRLIMEILRWASQGDFSACNYVSVESISRTTKDEFLINALDRIKFEPLEFRARHVINCAGPRSINLLSNAKAGPPMTLAFSLLLDLAPLSNSAVSVTTPNGSRRMFFLVPVLNRILAGTVHLPAENQIDITTPSDEALQEFIDDLNEAVPSLNASVNDIVRIFSGLLPGSAVGNNKTASDPIRLDHSDSSPSSRYHTVWGVKFTTARKVAEDTFVAIAPERSRHLCERPSSNGDLNWMDWDANGSDEAQLKAKLSKLKSEESVIFAEDIILRRSDWGLIPHQAKELATRISSLIGVPKCYSRSSPIE